MTVLVLSVLVLSLWVGVGQSNLEGSVIQSEPPQVDQRPESPTTLQATSVTAPVRSSFTPNEVECFLQRKVLYAENGQCYRLREKGPCANSSTWLVLDEAEAVRENGTLRPVCKVCSCCEMNLRVFWPKDGQCHKLSETKTLCPYPGTSLNSDPFGDGQCECRRSPPHIRYEQDVLNVTAHLEGCYPLYSRGPCASLHILTPVVLTGLGFVGQCTLDPCHTENEQNPNVTYATYAKDGRCYQLGTQGPCATAEETYGVHRITMRPQCILPVNTFYRVPVDPCRTGDCQREINLADDNTLFAQELLMAAERKKRRNRKDL